MTVITSVLVLCLIYMPSAFGILAFTSSKALVCAQLHVTTVTCNAWVKHAINNIHGHISAVLASYV